MSTDSGKHLRALKVSFAAFDPSGSGWLFALRGITILHSTDDGRHWTQRGQVPNANGLAVDVTGSLLYVYGPAGIARSTDGGNTFAPAGIG